MTPPLRYLLLQVRNAADPMRSQEVGCFARALGCERECITVHDLLAGVPTRARLDAADVVLLGGSGDYSVALGGPWLEAALETMRELVDEAKPTFASCWGFQAMARALGGVVVTDPSRAELGTLSLSLTPEGERDPVFGELGSTFEAQMGHQDVVDRLPEGATLLASSERVRCQAFRIDGKPIYCTQFHPELNRAEFLERLRAYPSYVETIASMTAEAFAHRCHDTPTTEALLRRFVASVPR